MAEFAGIRNGCARTSRLPLAALTCLILLCCAASAQDARWQQAAIGAQQLYQQGKYEQALPAAQAALRLAETTYGPAGKQVAISLNDLAMVLKSLNRFSEAEPLYRRALAVNEKLYGTEHSEVAGILSNLGELYREMGRLTEARDSLSRSLAIKEKALNPGDPSIAITANNLAAVCMAQGRYVEAETLARRALAIDEKAPGPESGGAATDLNMLGDALYHQGKYTQAEPPDIKALSINLKLHGNDHPLVADALNNVGLVYAAEGKYSLAEATLRRALAIDEKAAEGRGLKIASDLNNLAGLFKQQARFAEAEPLYRRALDIDVKALGQQHPTVAGVISNLAELYYLLGRYDQAESAYRQALSIREKSLGAGHPLVALTLGGMAQLRREQGQYQEAEVLYKRALSIQEKTLGPEHPQFAHNLNALGKLYLDVVQVPAAGPLFERALAIHQKTLGPAHPEVASDLRNLAEVYEAGGQLDKAAPLYERVIAIDEKAFGPGSFNMAGALLSLGSLRQRQDKFAEAEPLQKRALAILEATAGPDHPDTRAPLEGLAITYSGWGRTELASTYFDRELANLAKQVDSGLTYMSERQRLQFLGMIPAAFPIFFNFAVTNKDRDTALPGKMYDALLWEKGMVATNSASMRAKILDSSDREALSLFDRLTAKRAQFAALASAPMDDAVQWRRAMAQLDQEANAIETDLVKRSAALADVKNASRLTWHDVQKALKPDEAAVEYVRFVTPDQDRMLRVNAYVALVLTPSAPPRVVLLGEAQKLEAEPVAAYRADVARTRGISNAPAKDAGASAGSGAGAAYIAFWKPLEVALGSAKRVYVAADGVLNQVPIGLFTDSAGKLLLEKYDLRIVNSTKDIARPQRTGSGKTAVVIGNPAFDLGEVAQRDSLSKLNGGAARGGGATASTSTASAAASAPAPASRGAARATPLPPLPATQEEAQGIANSLKTAGWQVSMYTGNMALEEALARVRNPKVVHLATHGFFLAATGAASPAGPSAMRDPMLRSGLYFAGADRARSGERPAADLEDGILTAYEATQLHLQGTELVVLSACETGLGQQANGEGVFGLRRGLQEAGAESVLMSMWPVPDQETQELMTLFYQQWLGGLDKHEALRQAQLKERETVKQRYGRDLPYYWGAFVLVGR